VSVARRELSVRGVLLSLALLSPALALSACAGAPQTAPAKLALQKQAKGALDTAYVQDPTLATLLSTAQAYAVFPAVTKAGVLVGGASGEGVFYEHGKLAGYCSVSQMSVGAQLGVQTYIEVVVLRTPQAVAQFKAGDISLAAQATAVALEAGASTNAQYVDDVAVLTVAEEGLMAEASVGGQSFGFEHL